MTKLTTIAPTSLVKALTSTKNPRSQKLNVMFHYIPGVKEFVSQFAAFVLNLPSSSGGTLFDEAIDCALAEVDKRGLAPISVQAHVEGFPVLVREVVAAAAKAIGHSSVHDGNGRIWNPLSGPLSAFVKPGTVVRLTADAHLQSPEQKALLKSVILSHCLDFPRFRAISQQWDEVVA